MDIDIDSADRERILELIKHVPASIHRKDEIVKHNTGVYVTDIPVDPSTGLCTLITSKAKQWAILNWTFSMLICTSVYRITHTWIA